MRDTTSMAKKHDIRQVDRAAAEVGVDRAELRQLVHDEKKRTGVDSLSYQELIRLARELKETADGGS
jgi:hypothetical protein